MNGFQYFYYNFRSSKKIFLRNLNSIKNVKVYHRSQWTWASSTIFHHSALFCTVPVVHSGHHSILFDRFLQPCPEMSSYFGAFRVLKQKVLFHVYHFIYFRTTTCCVSLLVHEKSLVSCSWLTIHTNVPN